MGKFGAHAQDHVTANGTIYPAIGLVAAAGERGEVVELIMTGGGVVAAADTQHTAMAARMDGNAAGTKTDQTPEQFEEASAVATLLASTLYTAVPTNVELVYLVNFGFNQRGGMRWAVPKGEGININGDETELALAWQVESSVAGRVDANAHWWEP